MVACSQAQMRAIANARWDIGQEPLKTGTLIQMEDGLYEGCLNCDR